MIENLTQGDTAYLRNGRQVEFVASVKGHTGNILYIVRPIDDDEEDESEDRSYGDPLVVAELFRAAPTAQWDQRLVALRTQVSELEERKSILEAEIRAAKLDEGERKKRLMQNEAIARVDDFLAGKITHIVFTQYGVEIETFDEAMRYKDHDYEKVPNRIRLLTLYGKSNGNLAWDISRYYDGSGYHKGDVLPCTSLEQARSIAFRLISEKFQTWRDHPKQFYNMPACVASCLKLGFDVPEDVASYVREQAFANATKKLEEAGNNYAAARASLAALGDIPA